MTRISIITAFLNEESNLPRLRERLTGVVDQLGVDAEFVLVDDHSGDRSAEIAKQWVAEDCRAAYIRLARASGSHAAYSAGLAQCTGDCAVLLAADLQDPPPKPFRGFYASGGKATTWCGRRANAAKENRGLPVFSPGPIIA